MRELLYQMRFDKNGPIDLAKGQTITSLANVTYTNNSGGKFGGEASYTAYDTIVSKLARALKNSEPFSIMYWIKTAVKATSWNYTGYIGSDIDGFINGIYDEYNQNQITVERKDGTRLILTGKDVQDSTWHHVYNGYDGSILRIGVDGKLYGGCNYKYILLDSYTLGNNSYSRGFYHDDIAIVSGKPLFTTDYTVPTKPFDIYTYLEQTNAYEDKNDYLWSYK